MIPYLTIVKAVWALAPKTKFMLAVIVVVVIGAIVGSYAYTYNCGYKAGYQKSVNEYTVQSNRISAQIKQEEDRLRKLNDDLVAENSQLRSKTVAVEKKLRDQVKAYSLDLVRESVYLDPTWRDLHDQYGNRAGVQ